MGIFGKECYMIEGIDVRKVDVFRKRGFILWGFEYWYDGWWRVGRKVLDGGIMSELKMWKGR